MNPLTPPPAIDAGDSQAAKLTRVRDVARRWARSDDPHDVAAAQILLAALGETADGSDIDRQDHEGQDHEDHRGASRD